MELTVLHNNPQYFDECVKILNEEWPRSVTARLHSLKKSNDKFPVCLVLITKENVDYVIGHSRLSVVQGGEKSCLIESVIIRKSERGKGYGRIIMNESEKFVLSLGYKTMYLTTHDKQQFYKHLSYTECGPIVSFGMDPNLLPDHFVEQFLSLDTKEENKPCELNNSNNSETKKDVSTTNTQDNVSNQPPTGPPPPPPPPPPCIPDKSTSKVSKWDPRHVTWMKKELS